MLSKPFLVLNFNLEKCYEFIRQNVITCGLQSVTVPAETRCSSSRGLESPGHDVAKTMSTPTGAKRKIPARLLTCHRYAAAGQLYR